MVVGAESSVDGEPWKSSQLGQLADVVHGRAFKPSQRSTSGTPIIRLRNLSGQTAFNHVQGNVAPDAAVVDGDLLFAGLGKRGTFGPHLWRGRSGVLNQHIFNVRNLRGVEKQFLFYALQRLTSTIDASARGATGIVQVTKRQLEACEVLVPPLCEQRKIAAILASVDQIIERTEAVVEQLRGVKNAVMQELLTRGLPGRHTRFKQTEIGEIPEAWELLKLQNLATEITDGEHQGPRRSDCGVLLLSARNILDGRLDLSKVERIDETEYERIARRCRPTADDVLMSYSGSAGRVCRVPDGIRFGLVRSVVLVRADRSKIEPAYLEQSLRGSVLQTQIAVSKQQVSHSTLFKRSIRELRVPVPTLREQAEISDTLNCVDRRRESEKRTVHALQLLKNSLMGLLLTGKLRVTVGEATA
jgi:type I restriction enzyme, S subunit